MTSLVVIWRQSGGKEQLLLAAAARCKRRLHVFMRLWCCARKGYSDGALTACCYREIYASTHQIIRCWLLWPWCCLDWATLLLYTTYNKTSSTHWY